MNNRVEWLTDEAYPQYDALLRSVEHTLVYQSLAFRCFLGALLPDSESRYLCLFQKGKLAGAMPAFLQYNREFGNVLNSLPFFGSNGGVVVAPDAEDSPQVKRDLIDAFHQVAREESVVTSTIISNPLAGELDFYDRFSGATLTDDRIGQITMLPEFAPESTLKERLLGKFHRKTRNHIRKAQKSGLSVERTGAEAAFDTLASLHRQGMEAIGGRVKSARVFELLRRELTYPDDYSLYLGKLDGRVAAALLVLFFHRTAEYFVPATEASCRPLQPMSLLVFEAMQDAARRGAKYWNWGGTWLTQKGVYDFKSRWGTCDRPYRYYVREYGGAGRIRRSPPDRLLAEYPHFYVLPFHALETKPTDEST